MKFLKLQLGFDPYADDGLLTKSRLVLRSLMPAPPVAEPEPVLADLLAATNTFDKDLGVAVEGSRDDIATKNASRAELIKCLVKVGLWVMSTAGNNPLPLEQSGFTLVKTPQPRHIGPATEVTVINGITSGQIIIIGGTDKAAMGYQFMISLTEPSEATQWTVYTSSRSKYTISDLKRGVEVYVRYAVVGARNQVAYSNIVSHIVQ